MIADPWLRWVLVALFLFSAGYCAWRLVRPGIWRGKIGHVFNLLMCLSMLAMVEPGTPTAPYPAQIVVFGVATAWFAMLALSPTRRVCGKGPYRSAPFQGVTGFVCASGRAAVWYHAAMMAAMLWMVVVMAGWLADGRPSAAAPRSGGMAGMDMPGMSMPGMSMDAAAPSPAQHAAPIWISVVDVAFGVMFFAATLWWLRRYFELRKNNGRSSLAEAELLCEVAMALGMGVMAVAMV
ncbi:DUF5134 domain-containing protein [Segniliparus rugosus]|uniref:DUF5134 domain-containing protein n=1 Tax=Segniliparus rugosus (strain ATCC BAA-974 / DSM 45345 / CCUG 50838 / CIP 108380 / JCM 13579 / CDC 945) TaxID=679197 RepID=E5XVG6_SEGRC|nr:DUF5134 domain-containing protein [Segniliparus rugosus]EFV11664.1 hypothetical protein HMPREF9336_03488 [Segniliparus rugosus ATCC BAA-974]